MPPRSATSARALTQGRVTSSRRPSVAAQALTPAVLYARVSSKDQEKEGFSIPAQQKLLRAYAEERGFDVQREFTDVETAKRAGRTQFGQMLDWLKKHKGCRTILVEKTDRLYRNLKDYVVLEDLGLELHFVKEGSVISENARASDKLIHDIKVVMAKNYVANLSEETRKGMQEKAEQGIWPGPAPVGYRNVVRSDGKRIIDVDPDLGPLVTRLFQTYVDEDIAVQALAQRAAGWGLRTPRSGKPLTVASLHYALNNLLYTGAFVFKGKVYPGTHPPLVPRELWDRVQDKLQGRATYVRREQKHDFPFSGLVRCGACRDAGDQGERLMVGEMHKARYIYYRCDGCKKAGRPVVYIRQERLDQAMSRALRTLRLDEEVLGWVRKALHQSHAEQQRFHTEALARLNRQIDQLQRRIDVAYEDRLDGRIPSEEFDRLAAGWRAEQRRVRRDMEAHERADHNTLLDGVQILELAGRAADLYDRQPPEERQKLLKLVISNSIWRDDNLEVVWQQPFDIIAESVRGVRENNNPPEANPGGHSEWLPLLDLNQRPSD